ncbi:MAG: bifunctional phosphoribosylaminoimidazolecarboxamide formyltransferase/IMP cyclohydrolase PurH [Micrococcales bacterium]|nr:bifunctional phosphoribosylaminoimidazolecarboxamide formyltransferase/IMP cyclohydrolase PurH [Micrococcales bacterium]
MAGSNQYSPSDYRHRDRIQIKRALISVSDKTGLIELAQALDAAGISIVSTGSTASSIRAAGIQVTEVAEVTGFAEALDGRVKTLHPKIHGALLADLRLVSHEQQLAELGIEPFELVVVNLYPFVQTVSSGAKGDAVVEQIDIGGPAMVRGSAKNFANVAVVVEPGSYAEIKQALIDGGTTLEQRRNLAASAFSHTAKYDAAVASWFVDEIADRTLSQKAQQAELKNPGFPQEIQLDANLLSVLRYGENSHQAAAIYRNAAPSAVAGIAQAKQHSGKEMSFNNYVDADAAVRAAYDFVEPAVAIIKHANPCGIAIGPKGSQDPIADAYSAAYLSDDLSAFGGVVAANRTVTLAMAKAMLTVFTEVLIAPSYELEALRLLIDRKKNLRILELPRNFSRESHEIKQISGGFLVQESDNYDGMNSANWKLITGKMPDEQTMADLEFAWRAVRSVKSNAILLAKNGASVGIGMGQVNRVDACKLATTRGVIGAAGSVAASDAFFPYKDGVEVLINAGIKALVQPGGSQNDAEVIEVAKQANLPMFFTAERHFYH